MLNLKNLKWGHRCPLASPTSAVLQETKRGSRYWRLRSAVQQAVAAAYSDPGGHPCDEPTCALPELSSMPSPLEVRPLYEWLRIISYE